MPIRQQYYIATAVICLIAILVLFAIFDYRSDVQRFASQQPAPLSAGAAFTSQSPPPTGWGFDAQGRYVCPGCGWRGSTLMNSRCPSCYYCFVRGSGVQPQTGTAQEAPFLWRQPRTKSVQRALLYCPACDFSMSSRYRALPNTIKCPRCMAFLVGSVGQQAAFVPGGGTGLGRGLNPYCPIQ